MLDGLSSSSFIDYIAKVPSRRSAAFTVSSIIASLVSLPRRFFRFSFSSSDEIYDSFSLSLVLTTYSGS